MIRQTLICGALAAMIVGAVASSAGTSTPETFTPGSAGQFHLTGSITVHQDPPPVPGAEERKTTIDDNAAEQETAPEDVSLSPVTGFHDQDAIDTGALVLWRQAPYLLAGHDNLGWDWLDEIPTGTRITVTTGPAEGTYQVVDHAHVDDRGGQMPDAFRSYDLVLQTCTGLSGSGFSLAVRIG